MMMSWNNSLEVGIDLYIEKFMVRRYKFIITDLGKGQKLFRRSNSDVSLGQELNKRISRIK